jgi:glutamine cyclotransferase
MKTLTPPSFVLFAATLIIGLGLWSCGEPTTHQAETKPVKEAEIKETPSIQYTLVARHPHDTTAYTEGLLMHEGKLYESTGAPTHLAQTRSTIGLVDRQTGKLQIKAEIDRKIYFGEGMLILNNKVYQLTYQNQVGFIYDFKNFNRIGQFSYQNKEGWGMTTEGKHLIFSDGTCNLTFLDPETLQQVKTLAVTEGGYEVYQLNELEYINGFIYANIWMTNRIVKIDPANGQVVAALDLTPLFEQSKTRYAGLNEMNGIAFDVSTGNVLVTGKLWPDLYELKLPL